MIDYFDRTGKLIDYYAHKALFESQEYIILKRETLANGLVIQTNFVGHKRQGVPVLFETKVLKKIGPSWKAWRELEYVDHGSEADALKGQEEMLKKWKEKV